MIICKLMKTYNTEFDNITIAFTDENGRLLEIEDKSHYTLLFYKYKWCLILQNQENNVC